MSGLHEHGRVSVVCVERMVWRHFCWMAHVAGYVGLPSGEFPRVFADFACVVLGVELAAVPEYHCFVAVSFISDCCPYIHCEYHPSASILNS